MQAPTRKKTKNKKQHMWNEFPYHKKAENAPDEVTKGFWLWLNTNAGFDCSNEQMVLTGGSVAAQVYNLQSLLISKQMNSITSLW